MKNVFSPFLSEITINIVQQPVLFFIIIYAFSTSSSDVIDVVVIKYSDSYSLVLAFAVTCWGLATLNICYLKYLCFHLSNLAG